MVCVLRIIDQKGRDREIKCVEFRSTLIPSKATADQHDQGLPLNSEGTSGDSQSNQVEAKGEIP